METTLELFDMEEVEETKEEEEKIQLDCIYEIKHRLKHIINSFTFKNDSTYEKTIPRGKAIELRADLNKTTSPINELKFITTGENFIYAKEAFDLFQKMFNEGSKIIAKNGTNREIYDKVVVPAKHILDNLFVIENNPEDMKEFVFSKKQPFDETYFYNIARNIKIFNTSKENNIKLYQDELNGGYHINNIVSLMNISTDYEVYGTDSDIELGNESRKYGIITARGGLKNCSPDWVDVAFITDNRIRFFMENSWKNLLFANFYRDMVKEEGLFIFNTPFYRIPKLKNYIEHLNILSITNTGDEYGNLIFIVKKETGDRNKNNNLLRKAEFMPDTLPSTLEDTILLRIEASDNPTLFEPYYLGIEEIQDEFEDDSPLDFVFDNFSKNKKLQASGRPLHELKPGHVAMLATTGAVSGRFVDEVLRETVGETIGFDHLCETKIVRKEVENTEHINKNGEIITEISLQKSAVITSIAVTPEGEIIELFSTDTSEKEKDN